MEQINDGMILQLVLYHFELRSIPKNALAPFNQNDESRKYFSIELDSEGGKYSNRISMDKI